MFPFNSDIQVDDKLYASYLEILEKIGPILTPERRQKIDSVVGERTFSTVVVLEDIYDRGNASAVMRSAEAMGFAQFHMIETGEKFKVANRVSQGADKWVEVKKWKSTETCISTLKEQGKQIIVTHLNALAKPISEIDFSRPSALVLGNEKDGVSPRMVEMADHCVIIPMQGFVQSYNISVAGALSLYHIFCDRVRKLGRSGDLNPEQQEILKAVYYTRSLDSAKNILARN
jgi:tRNA (guanosine-2'-O-)-methyltransferase